MSYTPTVWKDGDLVTSAKLNKIEQAFGNINEVIVGELTTVYDDQTLVSATANITLQEIIDAPLCVFNFIATDGNQVIYKDTSIVANLQFANNEYTILLVPIGGDSTEGLTLTATSLSDYPSYGSQSESEEPPR